MEEERLRKEIEWKERALVEFEEIMKDAMERET